MTPALYTASVPVFDHYLGQLARLVERSAGREQMLAARLAPDMFTAAQQVATAAGFALRIAFPLAGAEPPTDGPLALDRIGLGRRLVPRAKALPRWTPPPLRVPRRAPFATARALPNSPRMAAISCICSACRTSCSTPAWDLPCCANRGWRSARPISTGCMITRMAFASDGELLRMAGRVWGRGLSTCPATPMLGATGPEAPA